MARTSKIMMEPSPRRAVQNLNTFHAIAAPDLCIVFLFFSFAFLLVFAPNKQKEKRMIGRLEIKFGGGIGNANVMLNESVSS